MKKIDNLLEEAKELKKDILAIKMKAEKKL